MKKLSVKNIVRLNQITIEQNGGQFIPPDNFLHPEQLNYLVDMVDASMFGQPLYPTITDKAALYMFNVISNHIFSDGNKRTGLTAALTFLGINGFQLAEELKTPEEMAAVIEGSGHDEILENFTLAVASAQVSLDECRAWFALNAVVIK